MGKERAIYVCSVCGVESSKWQGRCFSCGEFGSLDVRRISNAIRPVVRERIARVVGDLNSLDKLSVDLHPRVSTGFLEVNRVLGGGLVSGSVILLAGGPGVGKSTLLLQLSSRIVHKAPSLYISAEESITQLKLRAQRLGVDESKVIVCSETDVDIIVEVIKSVAERVGLVVVDSIQALSSERTTSYMGSVVQVRESARKLTSLCKEMNVPLIVTGHITKSGLIAGPKMLEHLVDVVLYLEGDRFSDLRLLRGVKNRFGNVLEVGVFRISSDGLHEIEDPSVVFLAGRKTGISGSVAAVVLEGARPLILEIQALTSPCGYDSPIRNVVGIGHKRLLMLLAVLQRRAGLNFARSSVFVNVSGGVRVFEPGVDFPVCLALMSSFKDRPIDGKTVAFGEVGLLGEVKQVARQKERVEIAKKMGFTKVLTADEVSDLKQALVIAGL
ncbi:DNA repair protein RadA [Patescibacteria group bacterium]|nr:DNA repair protein RadA [Patescibacteria group bacterium]MBU1868225.1 DNA repair protein RadA [Patescibacteria group bacterium]